MKQFLSILMVLGLAFSVQANEPSTVEDVTNTVGELVASDSASAEQMSNAERLVDKYSGKIADTFTKGLETVVPAAKDGFNMVVRYERAKGLAYLSPFFFFIIMIITGTVLLRTARKGNRDLDETLEGILAIVAYILSAVAFIAGVIMFGDGIMHLLAPEWYAIQDIVELFK